MGDGQDWTLSAAFSSLCFFLLFCYLRADDARLCFVSLFGSWGPAAFASQCNLLRGCCRNCGLSLRPRFGFLADLFCFCFLLVLAIARGRCISCDSRRRSNLRILTSCWDLFGSESSDLLREPQRVSSPYQCIHNLHTGLQKWKDTERQSDNNLTPSPLGWLGCCTYSFEVQMHFTNERRILYIQLPFLLQFKSLQFSLGRRSIN